MYQSLQNSSMTINRSKFAQNVRETKIGD